MGNSTRIEGLIHCGNPGETYILTKVFSIPIEPFPGLKIIVPGGHELTVESVMINTVEVALDGAVYVKFKDQVCEGAEKLFQSLIGDGWHEIDEQQTS